MVPGVGRDPALIRMLPRMQAHAGTCVRMHALLCSFSCRLSCSFPSPPLSPHLHRSSFPPKLVAVPWLYHQSPKCLLLVVMLLSVQYHVISSHTPQEVSLPLHYVFKAFKDHQQLPAPLKATYDW